MAGFGTPLRAGQVLPPGRLQRMQQGAFIETPSQGLFTGEIFADTDPSPNDFDTCRWMRTGRLGTVWWTGVIPAGFSPGDGTYNMTAPFPPDLEYVRALGTNDYGHRVGDGRIRDNSAGANSIIVVAQFDIDGDDRRIVFLAVTETNTSVTDDSQFLFAENDGISFRMRYPVDPRYLP